MIITCTGFSSQALQNGKIVLKVHDGAVEPLDEHLLLPEIAVLLKKSVKQVYKLSTRKKNPLPLRRGNGRPYGFRSEVNHWLLGDEKTPTTLAILKAVVG